MRKRRTRRLQHGLTVIENGLLLLIAAAAFLGLLSLFFDVGFKVALEKSSIALAIGLTGGLVAWSWKIMTTALQNRAQLRILELLSHGEPMTRQQIRNQLMAEQWLYRGIFKELYFDSLAALAMSGKVVVIEQERYSLPARASSK